MIVTALVFLLILSILVLIHEFGHFLVAKKFGIRVEEFGYGFPPRVWGKKIGETLYSINLLPIGGFVKLYGEDEAGAGRIGKGKHPVESAKKDLHRAFFARPAWQRALVVVAGVLMNVALAVVI
jgi:regulator of sigma E protease